MGTISPCPSHPSFVQAPLPSRGSDSHHHRETGTENPPSLLLRLTLAEGHPCIFTGPATQGTPAESAVVEEAVDRVYSPEDHRLARLHHLPRKDVLVKDHKHLFHNQNMSE